MKLPTLTPSQKAALAVFLTTFGGAAAGYLESQFEAGIPPENAWKHVVLGALGAGFVAWWHRYAPAPSQSQD